ncbi:MAG: hypothetical protein AB1458_16495 [Bacteroidota bacterium]
MARKLRLNRKTVNNYYQLIRKAIAASTEERIKELSELNQLKDFRLRNYSTRARKSLQKKFLIPKWGFYLWNEKIFMVLPENVYPAQLKRVLKGNSRKHKSYVMYEKLCDCVRCNPDFCDQFEQRKEYPTIWTYMLSELQDRKYIKRAYFYLHVREIEFRYNYGREVDFAKMVWKLFLGYRKALKGKTGNVKARQSV